jgi:hypothetical protein
MNSQIHLQIETEKLTKLQKEAESLGISISELLRRKAEDPATEEEIILLRKLRKIFYSKNT